MTKIDKFNKIASNPKNKSKEILAAIAIQEGSKILEIGVGGGYYAKLFAKIIGKKGRYYGIDTNEEFIKNLHTIAKSYTNITGIKIEQNELPEIKEKIDFIFTRNAYHHLEDRTNYFKKISAILKSTGKIIIIDYDESLSFFRLFGHYTKKDLIIEELSNAGFRLTQDLKILSKQSFLIFEKR